MNRLFNKLFFLTIASAIILSSCTNSKTEIVDKNGNLLSLSSVVEKQAIKADSLLSYCYYLPKNYKNSSKLPVLFFIDPHAATPKAINEYKSLAEKHQFIFVGSENIKNGMSAAENQHIFKMLMAETKLRFSVDEKRLFTAGFSGGAKLAIIYTQQHPEIIGVIACGGSIPMTANHQPNYYYAGVVGNKDFNYLEMQQTFVVFDQQGFDFTSIVFDGAHQWPPVNSFDLAISGLDIYAMKTQRKQKDEEWLNNLEARIHDTIAQQKERKDYLSAYQTIRQAVRWFYGLKPIKEFNTQSVALGQNPELSKQMQQMQALIKKEVKLRSAFIKAIETQDFEWWKTEVDKIYSSIKTGEKNLAIVSQRLLNYLSMASFMLTKTDLDDGRLDNAEKKLLIYELVDPKNPDVCLMYARFYLLNDDTDNMKKYYQKALDLGFTDQEQYAKDHSWAALFQKIEKDNA